MYLVVGLGNPDLKYLKTMHNMGFMAIDKLAMELGVEIDKKAFSGLICEIRINGEKVILLKPMTYMNLSGKAVKEAVDFFKIPLENVIVLYDDLDINIGSVRIRKSGSSGTHNGMRDIVAKLNSTAFPRVRIGIKPQNTHMKIIDYVLSQMPKESEELIKLSIINASTAVKEFLNGKDLDRVMCEFNK